MRLVRIAARICAVLAIWLGLARFVGRLEFTPGMTDALIQVTTWLDIDGIEDVEDFYMAVTLALSLAVAIGIVALGSRLLRRVTAT
ncbi:hypothetical protein [Roseomonas populi]|uniref:Uncharacterized protein n=1 Tax=Roseomonas populi TaxID=3121582 RepID=A0ABT1XAF6_9PROT|nr:hypothetical protein [Roseomonas pecuniae]MCR0985079.1 hypothetical protein [Roseomonas pecuniae]